MSDCNPGVCDVWAQQPEKQQYCYKMNEAKIDEWILGEIEYYK